MSLRRLLPLVLVLSLTPAFRAEGAAAALKRWADAVSVGGAPIRVRSVSLRGDVTEAGISGQFEEWLDRGSRRRVTTEESRSREDVVHGGSAWAKDWNGKVEEIAGRDRSDAITAAAIEALVFGGAVHNGAARTNVELVANAGDAPGATALRFRPEGGNPFDVTLDPATGLPAKAVRKSFDDVITLAFTDWRDVQGMRVPFSIRESTGGDDEQSTIVLREVTLSRKPAATTFARPADGPKDYKFAAGSSALGIPFHFGNTHIMVEARANGSAPLWYLLDTGADMTIVNKPRMEAMGLKPFGATSVTGGGNSASFAYTDLAELKVGGVTMLGQRVGAMDLSGLEKIYGMPMGGLLGYDFLSRFVTRVNYDTNTLDLIEPSGYVYKGNGVKLPFILENGHPHVSATITVPSTPPIAADVVVDAGAAGTVNLTSPFVKANRLLELAHQGPVEAPRTMAGSEKEFFAQTSVPGKLTAFKLAGIELKDVPTTLMMGTTGVYASESFAGTIGQGLLRRFNSVYDYARGVFILEPRADFAAPFPSNPSIGVTFLSDGPDYKIFTVTGVKKDGPGDGFGFKKGDIVTAVDGKPASALSLEELRKLLVEDGAHRVVEVKRGDENVTLDFTVKLVTPS